VETLKLDPASTALVLIDLQQGIVAMPTAPHSGPQVLERAASLLAKFRAVGAVRVLVHVGFAADGKDLPPQLVDQPMGGGLARSPEFFTFAPQIAPQSGEVVILKHQWGAFYGTELDLQLRRRGVKTIVIGGISTNMGVESTARDGWERSYNVVLVEDAMAAMSAEAHQFAVKQIFPRLGWVRSTQQVLDAL